MNLALNFWNLEDDLDACVFFKIKTTQIPKYLYELILSESHIYSTQNSENVETYYCETDLFKYSFFHILQLNEIKLISIYTMPNLCWYLETNYWKLEDQCKIQFIIYSWYKISHQIKITS